MFRCFVALSATLLLGFGAGCSASGDEGGGASEGCVVAAGECPNICDAGLGVEFETCVDGEGSCGCGLECVDGACAPMTGEHMGCSCGAGESVVDAEGIGDGTEGLDDGGPEEVDEGKSFYTMTVSLPDGTVIEIDRDESELRDDIQLWLGAHRTRGRLRRDGHHHLASIRHGDAGFRQNRRQQRLPDPDRRDG